MKERLLKYTKDALHNLNYARFLSLKRKGGLQYYTEMLVESALRMNYKSEFLYKNFIKKVIKAGRAKRNTEVLNGNF